MANMDRDAQNKNWVLNYTDALINNNITFSTKNKCCFGDIKLNITFRDAIIKDVSSPIIGYSTCNTGSSAINYDMHDFRAQFNGNTINSSHIQSNGWLNSFQTITHQLKSEKKYIFAPYVSTYAYDYSLGEKCYLKENGSIRYDNVFCSIPYKSFILYVDGVEKATIQNGGYVAFGKYAGSWQWAYRKDSSTSWANTYYTNGNTIYLQCSDSSGGTLLLTTFRFTYSKQIDY